MKKRVLLLRIDGGQVIEIPEEFELDTDDVVIYRRGDALVIEPPKESGSDDSTRTAED
ncbi:hypothetical protein HPT29_009665 [Microvirga terrae]|uniref:AbrB/MazE/SpoVT family DNA-binding domain-containing protein n=1 Tax=Microvirga terrae TaxID=2740529 RepID=A0ABY5RVT1_9HYPH|nr:hypothetical protein [Microvirga terrae]UVF21365.1 hypothetical protein HPT29_009665 [Microvirga terrae]